MIIIKFGLIFLNLYGFSNGNEINCGKKVIASGFIIGGIASKKNEWPWLVSLVSVPTRKFFCGATIITERTVLTAAHCIQSKKSSIRRKISEFEVQLGKHSLNESESESQIFNTDVIILHPDWDPNDDRYDADLSVLVSRRAINVSVNILPVCLWSGSNDRSRGIVVGWGVSEHFNLSHSEDTPRQVEVEKVSTENCFIEYHLLASIASTRTFCVRGIRESSGPCLGDSGGGFFVQIGNSWFIEGIVSSSFTSPSGKCDVTQLTLFTDLWKYKNWLSQQTKSRLLPLDYISSDDLWFDVVNLTVKSSNIFLTLRDQLNDLEVTQLAVNDQDINFFPNNIGTLFPNLKKLRSTNSNIKEIERLNFKDMQQLKYLDLSHNILTTLPFDVFYDLENLEELDLYNNTLTSLHPKIFNHNLKLKVIYASYNKIETLEAEIFSNNGKLRKIFFDNNLLKKINCRFDSRFSDLYLDLNDNICTSQEFKFFDDLSFISVNADLEESC